MFALYSPRLPGLEINADGYFVRTALFTNLFIVFHFLVSLRLHFLRVSPLGITPEFLDKHFSDSFEFPVDSAHKWCVENMDCLFLANAI